MNDLRELLTRNSLICNKITLKNNVKIIDTDKGTYVIKNKKNYNLDNTYKYLLSRSFDYFPEKIEDDNYDIYPYIEDAPEPNEQKIVDLVYITSLLHSKTTFYKEVDIDDYKYIYESINTLIEKSNKFYEELLYNINQEVYMAPSSYLLARNINIIFSSLNYSKKNMDKWYELVKDKRKIRYVNIHNNLSLDHYLKKDKPYLISWDKSRIDLPIYDLINLYKNHYLEFDFEDIFKLYENKYPLLAEEKSLLFIILMLPETINLNVSEYKLCVNIRLLIDYLYKTNNLISKYGVESK